MPPLEWKPIAGSASSISLCGNYSTGVDYKGRWSAWKFVPSAGWFASLEPDPPDEVAAKSLCQADADAKAAP